MNEEKNKYQYLIVVIASLLIVYVLAYNLGTDRGLELLEEGIDLCAQ